MARRDTRSEILAATERVARRKGMTRVTTRDVATEAGCSEAAIYYHFADRTDLLADLIVTRIAEVTATTAKPPPAAGATLRDRLTDLVSEVAEAFRELIALSSPLVADPAVLARFREVVTAREVHLQGIAAAVTQRLCDEQAAGAMRDDADAQVLSLLIVGACHELALEAHLMGRPGFEPRETAARIATLVTTLAGVPTTARPIGT